MKLSAYFLHSGMMLSLLLACGSGHHEKPADKATASDEFSKYWYSGEAELTSYRLEQARYGEIHPGTAVLVFVTEDFSLSKQVKLDEPGKHPEDAIKVMKLNFVKKFVTGIYPYSMMQSVFTSADDGRTLKVTTSSQEWCGHTFTQLNLKKDKYDLQLHSYFESEGEQSRSVKKVFLEDEIWTWIRLFPEKLPTGDIDMIRGTFAARLLHLPVQAEKVKATIKTLENGMQYEVFYPSDNRSLTILFDKEFPHEIQGWKETCVSGWGDKAHMLTTVATRQASIKTDYWRKNHVSDSLYRRQLGLE